MPSRSRLSDRTIAARAVLYGTAAALVVGAPLARGDVLADNPTVAPPAGAWTAPALPGAIEAEAYDIGGEGIGYHDTDAVNRGGSSFRAGDGVDIKDEAVASGGHAVGWFANGEWLDYTLAVPAAGDYRFFLRGADVDADGALALTIDGQNAILATLHMPQTASYATFAIGPMSVAALPAGTHTFRLTATGAAHGYVGDLDEFIVLAPGTADDVTVPPAAASASTPAQLVGALPSEPTAPPSGAAGGKDATADPGRTLAGGPDDPAPGPSAGAPSSAPGDGKAPAPASAKKAGTAAKPTTSAGRPPAVAAPPVSRVVACPTSASTAAVGPGSNLNALVASAPAGTVFRLAPGTYSGQSIAAKAGDAFCGAGEGQTILDGGNQGMTAIYAPDGSADNVVVQGMTIQNYGFSQTKAYGSRFGAVDSDASSDRAQGWRVTQVDAEHNGFGIFVGSNSYVAGNIVNNNSLYGLGAGSNNTIFEYNDITNNDLTLGGTGDSGGTKTAASTGVIYRYNKVVNNGDMGLWTDTQNTNCDYDHNYLSGNHNSGIFHEISYNCSIHDNVVINNGNIDAPGWLYGGGISISSSGGINGGTVNVYNNYLVGNANGITVFQQNRGGPDSGLANALSRWCTQNVDVHDNTIIMTTGKNNGGVTGEGSGGDPSCPAVTQAGNTWSANSYYVNSTGGAYWQDTAGPESFSVWQSHGNDTAGAVQPASAAPAPPTFATGAGAF